MIVAGEIAGLSAIMGLAGGAIKYVWDKIESRFQNIEADLAACHAREAQAMERRSLLLTVNELFCYELQRVCPGSAILARAKVLMCDVRDKLP